MMPKKGAAMPRIIPSIASSDPLNIERTLRLLGDRGSLHLDIEDGNFIPNITFGMKTVRAIHRATSLPLNAHLMVTNPMDYLAAMAECGVTELCFHVESHPYPLQILNRIKSLGMKAGLAFNFSTPVSAAEPFCDDADFLLIMTSEEDGKGQIFHPRSLKRIAEARRMLAPEKSVWVDGGIGEAELPLVCGAGADTVIMGRAVVNAEDPWERIRYFTDLR